ncbi:hypothetical protein PoB_003581300 [Plakobranchus ocellatus]|uniref:Uncharacterized protein n=1 Tax=Plakobranchus ocellatus TaxID=259542 RepID=A0AAV4APL7_9GAST|nr:hypothetical protein PoB_003581300 [Plakobranchus ocellatus]
MVQTSHSDTITPGDPALIYTLTAAVQANQSLDDRKIRTSHGRRNPCSFSVIDLHICDGSKIGTGICYKAMRSGLKNVYDIIPAPALRDQNINSNISLDT